MYRQMLLGFFLLFIVGCSIFQFSGSNTSQEIPITQPSFSLAWDYDKIGLSENEQLNMVFSIYAKPPNVTTWQKLGTIKGKPLFAINTSMHPPGRYIFAVTATIDSQKSEKHTSEDDSAYPIVDWHVL